MGIKVKLPTIENRIKKLAKFGDKILFPVATRLKALLLLNYGAAKGADDKPMPKLTKKYRDRKSGTGRLGIRDLRLSGRMLGAMSVRKKDFTTWLIKFQTKEERDKAKGNTQHAKNMMTPISDRIDKKLQKLAFKLFTR